ncbi:putative metallo-hydrolase [Corynebacterium freiburgense]|nr:putative metallo-hydrolase [Corynebacterium freiburgense]
MGFAAGPFKTNCYLIANDGHVVVVDPGMHSLDRIVAIVEERNLQVDKVLLTHGHIDHTRDAAAVAKRWNVPVCIHAEDAFMITDPPTGVAPTTALLFDATNMGKVHDLRFFVDKEVLDIAGEEFIVRHAPGHSPGCVIFVGTEVCFTGDVVFQGSIGRTDLIHSDPEAMQESLRNVVLSLDDALHLLPGHGPATTMRAERIGNPFLQNLAV